jgi:polyisoprenoid-binding protein YceI
MSIKNLFLGLLTLATFFTTAAFTGPAETYTADVEKSKIIWKGYKVTGEHTGTINLKSADLEMEEGNLTGGSFVIDMASITCTDLEGKYKGKLEGHLKSADFFGVEEHPTANFKITKVVSRGTPGDYKVVGNLTIKNITKEIKFMVNINESIAKATLKIDRSDFDVRYGSGSFFDKLGDKTIYDEFDLAIEMVIKK